MTKKFQITSIISNTAKMAGTVDDNILARAIGTMLYDIPATRSGLVSVGLIDDFGYRPAINKCTQEHFLNRQKAGRMIIEAARDGIMTDEWLKDFIDECTTVHLTTSEENTRLSAIQNHPETADLSWEQQYELAGIEMITDPGVMPIKMRNLLKKIHKK